MYRAVFTRDSFFQGFAKQRLQHGPNFQALKTVDNLTKKNASLAAYKSQKHLIGVCRFPKVWVNWYEAFDRFFWDFAHQNSDCETQEIETDWVRKSVKDYKSDLAYVAYPRSETMPNDIRQHYGLFRDEHMRGMKKIADLNTKEADEFHSFLDFTHSQLRPTLRFQIKRNEQLLAERRKIIAASSTINRPDVLVVMLDSLSRQHFFRKMPKTAQYFEKFFKTADEKKAKSEEQHLHSAYQFFRYHALRQHHSANLLALRYDDRET